MARKLPIYFEALAPLSPDLVELGIRRCIAVCKFIPRPAEIREQVAGELEERAEENLQQLRERYALQAPKDEPEPWTPERLAEHEAKMAEVYRRLDGNPKERAARMRPIGEILAGYSPAAPDAVLRTMREAGLAPDGSTIRLNGKDPRGRGNDARRRSG